jgi:hypothetical protein
MIKRLVLTLLLLGITATAFAGQIEDRKRFFFYINPSTTIAYSGATSSNATGDVIVCNTYTRKTIQVYSTDVGEYDIVQVEGRTLDSPYWSILSSIEFAKASTDIARNAVVDIPQYIDFLRVGIKSLGTNNAGTDGTSIVYVYGIFSNLER